MQAIAPNEDQIARLTNEHRAIKLRLRELDHNPLTSAEKVERAQLEKRKLETKDRLLRLQQH